MARPSEKPTLNKKIWYRSRRQLLVWAAFLSVSAVMAGQLLYPSDRALPSARLGNQSVSSWHFNDIATKVNQDFATAELTLRVNADKAVTYPLAMTGAQPNIELIRTSLVEYPLWQRLIPLSIMFRQPRVSAMPVYFTTSKLEQFASDRAMELSQPPQNAGLDIIDGRLVATRDQPGVAVNSDSLQAKLINQFYSKLTVLAVPRQIVPAEKPASYFAQVQTRALNLLDQAVVISVDDEEHQISRPDLASFFEIVEAETDGGADLALSTKSVDQYLKQLQSSTRTASTPTNVRFVDGAETGRTTGKAGRQINIEALAKQLQKVLLDEQDDQLVAQFVAIKPEVIINNTYSSSEAGLRAFVSDEVNKKNVRIAIEQLDGEGWTAYGRADETTVSASTYKLFVALRLLEDMKSGKVSWGDRILDTDVRGCFERMIVVSLNTCAETWINGYGRSGINNYLWGKGFSSGTDFNNVLATHTTARDLVRYMHRLYDGDLLPKNYRKYLLDALNRHGYTSGIPGGSQGRVHNKVGYLWDYSNDTAIVYHPKGTYAIAVLTKGLSFYAIADVVRQAEMIMYP